MVWWCPYIIWSGADLSDVVSITLYGLVLTGLVVSGTLYGLVWTGLVGSVLVFGLGQPGLLQSYYGLVQSCLEVEYFVTYGKPWWCN